MKRKTIKRIFTTHITKSCTAGDIIMTVRAPVGKVGKALFDACIGRGVCAVSYANDYLYHYLISLEKHWTKLSKGSTFDSVNSLDIKELPIPLPPLQEQKALAKVLSDVDELITSIEELIDKKQKIKQGMMQLLLTGKKRLPGFTGEWEVKKLGGIADVRKGQLITEKSAVSGNIPVIGGGKKSSYYHNKPNRIGKTITISASGAYAGYVSFYDTPIFASDCSTISDSDTYAIEYIYYYLCFKQKLIYNIQTGGAQPHIYPRDVQQVEVYFPPLPEQKTIAQILSDMDLEIEALEEKLEKYKLIKDGMMEQLLTGKVRLI